MLWKALYMDKAGMAHCPVLGVSVQLASPDNSSVPQAVAADTPRLWGEPDTDCTAKTQLPSATVITPAPSLLPCSPGEPQYTSHCLRVSRSKIERPV